MLFPCHNLHLNIGWSYVIHTVHQLWLFVYYNAIHKSTKHIHCMQCLYLIKAVGLTFCMNECPSHQGEIKIVRIRCNREIASCGLKKLSWMLHHLYNVFHDGWLIRHRHKFGLKQHLDWSFAEKINILIYLMMWSFILDFLRYTGNIAAYWQIYVHHGSNNIYIVRRFLLSYYC